MYNETIYLIKAQIGPDIRDLNLEVLEKNIYNYYNELQKQEFFDHEYEPYVFMGGPPEWAQSSYRYPAEYPQLSGGIATREHPESLPKQKYPEFIPRN